MKKIIYGIQKDNIRNLVQIYNPVKVFRERGEISVVNVDGSVF